MEQDQQIYDAIIIGAGVSGCSIAREFSRLQGHFLVLEAEDDVCSGTSKANSAIVHAGFDAQEGSLMARLNVEGNQAFPRLAEELGFAFEQCGSLVVCTDDAARPQLEALLARGVANGVPDLRIVERDELLRMEPNISERAVCALWAPTGGICDPFGLTLAFAENAAANGVAFRFDEPVTAIARADASGSLGKAGSPAAPWLVTTSKDAYRARSVINAAGVHADEVHNMVAEPDDRLTITPRKGEYELLDTTAGSHVRHTVFMLPTAMGKGVLVTPTVHGNLLVGPTADDVDDKHGTNTTAAGLASVREKAALTVRDIPWRETIASFAGLRAHQPGHEFIIGEVAGAPGFIDCAGIESPGLTASPAIGRMVAGIAQGILQLPEKACVIERRRPIPNLEKLSADEWNGLIRRDPAYGRIVCRCRHVSEAQILDAIHRTPGARSLDGVKRRTWACTGRCQAGFCTPRIAELLAQELYGGDLARVTKAGPGSELVEGYAKDGITDGVAEAYAAAHAQAGEAQERARAPKGGEA